MIKIHVTNLLGDEFPLMATTTNDLDLNGNQSISLKITSNKVNDLFINDFAQLWRITDLDDVEHKVIYAKKQGIGDKLYIDVKGIPLFFDKLDNLRIYEEINSHLTANAFFTRVFKDTGFNFVLMDSFDAIQWEGLGKGETNLSAFKKGLNRYKAEFKIVGNTVYLHFQIGRDTSIMYRHKLNASNIVQEIDAANMWTHAKGFGDYEEGDEANAKLKREYTSLFAQIPGIGIRHAPPIYDGRVKVAGVMDASLKTLVDESLKISVSATIHNLKDQGYPIDQAELGDRVFLMDPRIKLNDEVRVNNISKTRDWRGKILDINIVFGSEGIAKRHQSDIKAAIDRINELIEGKIKLPSSVLDDAILIATKALQAAQTELHFTDNGILAIDKNNPNYVVLLNSAGVGVSEDGGHSFRTAMTGRGINADLIVVGTMLFDRIKGGTLTLGGSANGNGKMVVLNDDDEVIADLDAERGGYERLFIGDIDSPSIENAVRRNVTFNATTDDSIQNFLDDIGKLNSAHIQIVLQANIVEDLHIRNFSGAGRITLDMNGYRLNGTIRVFGCTNLVSILNGTQNVRAGTPIALEIDGSRIIVDAFKQYGNGSGVATYMTNGASATIVNSETYGFEYSYSANYNSMAYIEDCTGLSEFYGIFSNRNSKMGVGGTIPRGNIADTSKVRGGTIDGTYTTDNGAATPPPVPDVTTTWASTTARSWRPNFGGQWHTEINALQGQWGQYGLYKGLWFFGSAPRNAVNGKAIKRIRVKLTRASNSGDSKSVNAIIRPHGYASQPSGEPSFLNASHSVGFRWGESKWVTLPSSFHALFANGSAYGIGIYTTSTSNANYMRFLSSAEIEITYA